MDSAVDPDYRLALGGERLRLLVGQPLGATEPLRNILIFVEHREIFGRGDDRHELAPLLDGRTDIDELDPVADLRSEEHTSELQSLMRISYALFCLKKKDNTRNDSVY